MRKEKNIKQKDFHNCCILISFIFLLPLFFFFFLTEEYIRLEERISLFFHLLFTTVAFIFRSFFFFHFFFLFFQKKNFSLRFLFLRVLVQETREKKKRKIRDNCCVPSFIPPPFSISLFLTLRNETLRNGRRTRNGRKGTDRKAKEEREEMRMRGGMERIGREEEARWKEAKGSETRRGGRRRTERAWAPSTSGVGTSSVAAPRENREATAFESVCVRQSSRRPRFVVTFAPILSVVFVSIVSIANARLDESSNSTRSRNPSTLFLNSNRCE